MAFTPKAKVHAETPGDLWHKVAEEITKTKSVVISDRTDNKNNKDNKDDKDNQAESPAPPKEEQKEVPMDNADLKEVEKQAEFASQETGVRKEFLMGMLVVESDMGQNTGECTYQEVMDGASDAHQHGNLSDQAWQTFQDRKKIIQDIANDLGYDYVKLKVSCNPSYAGTGGAMGIPQFMPDTWLEYKDKIKAILGTDKPDPWSVRDGVLAMALKVADVPGVTEHNQWAERDASKLYLSGTTAGQYNWYASEIQYWANNYKQLLG